MDSHYSYVAVGWAFITVTVVGWTVIMATVMGWTVSTATVLWAGQSVQQP